MPRAMLNWARIAFHAARPLDLLKETTMKSHATASILAAVALASFASMALLAPTHHARAENDGSSTRATAQTKVNTGLHNETAGKVECAGPGCPGARANAVKATTTGTYKAPCRPGDRFCRPGH